MQLVTNHKYNHDLKYKNYAFLLKNQKIHSILEEVTMFADKFIVRENALDYTILKNRI